MFIIGLSYLLLFTNISCRKQLIVGTLTSVPSLDSNKIFKTASTPAELLLVENIEKLTEVLKELYKDGSNLKLVNAAIFSEAYSDNSVLVKDLIYPEESRLRLNSKFRVYCEKFGVTSEGF